VAGALTAIALAIWRSPATRRAAVVRRLESARPEVRNLLVTAEELSSNRLVTKPAVRERVFADAAASARQIDLAAVLPIARVVRVATLACAVWIAVLGLTAWRGPLGAAARAVANASAPVSDRLSSLRFTVSVQPPSPRPRGDVCRPGAARRHRGQRVELSIAARAGA
jgi:hypothetical protein